LTADALNTVINGKRLPKRNRKSVSILVTQRLMTVSKTQGEEMSSPNPLDHTLEIGEMKAQLAKAIHDKEIVAQKIMAESDKYSLRQQEALAQRGIVASLKMQSKILEDKIKAIKTFLRTETQFG
jgi:hypothetical protein